MSTIKTILLSFGILISFKAFSCTCETKTLSEWQKTELENSELIFIGEVFEINETDNSFKIRVNESLNDIDNSGKVYSGKNWNHCGPYVSEKGKWIIYGKIENGVLRLNMCGISRSFESPMVNPIPPSPDLLKKALTEEERLTVIEQNRTENIKNAISDLTLEIKTLRKIRDKK